MVITEEIREELNQAAMATSQAYIGTKALIPGEAYFFYWC